MELVQRWMDLVGEDQEEANRFYVRHCADITRHMRAWLDQHDRTFYYYMITFTLKPGLKPKQVSEAELYIERQFTDRPALQVQEAYIVKEFTKANVAHWHVSVKTAIPLSKDRFNYYTKIYGTLDISKNKQQNLQDGLNYISKSGIPKKLA